MKKTVAILFTILFLVPALSAQHGGRRRRYRYDAAKEKVYAGVVVKISERQGRRGPRFRVSFNAGGVVYRLSVGPKGWLAGKGISLAAGTRAVVRGVVYTGRRGTMLIARTIRSRGKKVVLRDANGRPSWLRRRRHRRDGDSN